MQLEQSSYIACFFFFPRAIEKTQKCNIFILSFRCSRKSALDTDFLQHRFQSKDHDLTACISEEWLDEPARSCRQSSALYRDGSERSRVGINLLSFASWKNRNAGLHQQSYFYGISYASALIKWFIAELQLCRATALTGHEDKIQVCFIKKFSLFQQQWYQFYHKLQTNNLDTRENTSRSRGGPPTTFLPGLYDVTGSCVIGSHFGTKAITKKHGCITSMRMCR